MMSCSRLKTVEDLVGAFDEHLRRVRGVCAGTRCGSPEIVEVSLCCFSVEGSGLVVDW